MTDKAADFAGMVPGFDFLQGLVKNAGSVLPSMGQWVAPTLDPDELEKRIEELRTVKFWLEQNARMLATTIQALEVQRMTLSTLKSMNVQVADLRESLRIKLPDEEAAALEPASDEPTPAPAENPDAAEPAAAKPRSSAKKPAAPESASSQASATTPAAGVVDPTQWWGALTQQFTQLAANAIRDAASDPAKLIAGNPFKQSLDAAEQFGMPARQTAASDAADAPARKTAAAKTKRRATGKTAGKAPARKKKAKPARAPRES